MSFLAPLFLLGGLALALPVIFHLVRRSTRERMAFGSLMFLRPAPPRLTRRNRLEHLLLLLLRCLAILLLAIGFSRPFFSRAIPDTAAAGAPRRIVVLLDSSASMHRGALWAQACARAESILRSASAADQAALFTFDRELKPLVTFDHWKSSPPGDRDVLVRGHLAKTSPGWAGTYLDQAVIQAVEMLTDAPREQAAAVRQVILITDWQAGSRLAALQGYEWPKGIELIVERILPKSGSNAGVQWLADRPDAGLGPSSVVRVRVSNEPDSKREQFQVVWTREGQALGTNALSVYVPPGQSRVVAIPVPAAASGLDRIALRGDDEAFDNTVYVIPPEPVRVGVIYLGGEPEGDSRHPLFFLQRAFQNALRQSVTVTARQPSAALSPSEIEGAALYIVTDNLPDTKMAALAAQVRRGKTLLFAPVQSGSASTLAALVGIDSLRLDEASPSTYAMLAEIDFRHPLFAPFADPKYSDFTPIHFWKYRRLDTAALPGARVLAKFDTGDPALVEMSVGKGRVIVLASGWHPSDSQLALSTKFVPLLYSLLETSGASAPAPAQWLVGDSMPLPPEAKQTAVERVGAGGLATTVSPATTNSMTATVPGIYRLKGAFTAWRCAVNMDPAESRTSLLPLDELDRLGAPIARPALSGSRQVARQVQLRNVELESRQKLWRWFLVATLAVLLIETWLAGRTARRQAMPEGGSV